MTLVAAGDNLVWRKVPVTEYEEKFHLHNPSMSDLTVAQDGTIYMAHGQLSRLVGNRWVSVDSDAQPLRFMPDDRTEEGFYRAAVKRKTNNARGYEVRAARIDKPDRMNGLAARAALDDAGRFWVLTPRARVFRGNRDNWQRMPVMASAVHAGPGGQAILWSPEVWVGQFKNEHDRWLKANPNPMLFDGTRWIDLAGLPAEPWSFAFSPDGDLWMLTYVGGPDSGEGHIYRRVGERWQPAPGVPDGRHIESDLQGNLWVLSYSQHKTAKGWRHRNARIFRWGGAGWIDDPSIPDLRLPPKLGAFQYGTVLEFNDRLTFAHSRYWMSLLEVSDEKYAEILAIRSARDEPAEVPAIREADDMEPVSHDPPAGSSPGQALQGCWFWSNGAYVEAFDDGRITVGGLTRQWRSEGDDGSYSVAWPAIEDTWTLAPDGNSFQATTSLDMRFTGTRLSGDPASAAGRWQRSDGVTLDLDANGHVTAGQNHATWQTGPDAGQVVLQWPVVDQILVARDGESLTTSTQFLSHAAVRDPGCARRR